MLPTTSTKLAKSAARKKPSSLIVAEIDTVTSAVKFCFKRLVSTVCRLNGVLNWSLKMTAPFRNSIAPAALGSLNCSVAGNNPPAKSSAMFSVASHRSISA